MKSVSIRYAKWVYIQMPCRLSKLLLIIVFRGLRNRAPATREIRSRRLSVCARGISLGTESIQASVSGTLVSRRRSLIMSSLL